MKFRKDRFRHDLDGIFDKADTSYHVYDGNVFHPIGRTGPPSVLFNLDHGIYTCGKHHLIVNNIFYQQAVPNAIAFVAAELRDVVLRNNLVFGGGLKDDNDHGACLVSGTIRDRDPMFVDPESGDFHLKARSPAIGAGIRDRAPRLDMDGKRREEKRCDLGAAGTAKAAKDGL